MAQPIIDSIAPLKGAEGGGTTVLIGGSNFGSSRGTGTVFFGDTEASSYISWTDTEVEVLSGAGVGYVVVTISNGDGETSATGLYQAPFSTTPGTGIFRDEAQGFFVDYITNGIFGENEYHYIEGLGGVTITSVTPDSGKLGTIITIDGQYFGTARGFALIGDVPLSIISWSNTQIRGKVAYDTTPGLKTVYVYNPDSTNVVGSLADAFTYGSETGDCIQARVTANIKAALQSMASSPYVEELRTANYFNQYPYILLVEDDPEYDVDYQHTGEVRYEYTLIWFSAENDEGDEDPFTNQNRNVVADMIKSVMADRTRGGLAINTIIEDSGHATFVTDIGVSSPGTYLVLSVHCMVNSDNPYELA